MSPSAPPPVQAIVLDVGNVLVGVDFDRAARAWGTAAGENWWVLASRFTFSKAYEQHERGEIDWKAYCDAIREELGIQLGDTQLQEGWNAIFTGAMPGIEALLEQLPDDLPLFAFSNTNAVHYECLRTRHSLVFSRIERFFCSHELGKRKPEPAAFRHVIDAVGAPAQHIVFFDDSLTNVEAARAQGLNAYHSTSTADVRAGLRGAGLSVG